MHKLIPSNETASSGSFDIRQAEATAECSGNSELNSRRKYLQFTKPQTNQPSHPQQQLHKFNQTKTYLDEDEAAGWRRAEPGLIDGADAREGNEDAAEVNDFLHRDRTSAILTPVEAAIVSSFR